MPVTKICRPSRLLEGLLLGLLAAFALSGPAAGQDFTFPPSFRIQEIETNGTAVPASLSLSRSGLT